MPTDKESTSDLEMEANVVHVNSWNSQALDSYSFSPLPVIVNVIKHIVSNSPLP